MERFTRCKLLLFILVSFKLIEAKQNQAMFTHYVATSRTLSELHLAIRCGMKCNLEKRCQGFARISSGKTDSCSLQLEHFKNLETAGNEDFHEDIFIKGE